MSRVERDQVCAPQGVGGKMEDDLGLARSRGEVKRKAWTRDTPNLREDVGLKDKAKSKSRSIYYSAHGHKAQLLER